jgi:hypothetical protein
LFPNCISLVFQLIISEKNVWSVHERPFRNPFRFFPKPFWVSLQFYINFFTAYCIAVIKNTSSSVNFRVSSATFHKYFDYNVISPFVWNTTFLFIYDLTILLILAWPLLVRTCITSINVISPEHLPFFVNCNSFSN